MAFVPDEQQQPARRFVPDAPASETKRVQGRVSEGAGYADKFGKALDESAALNAESSIPTALQPLVGGGEAALQAATGTAAPVLGALRTGLNALLGNPDDYEAAKASYTYEPRTNPGKAATKVVGAASAPVGDALTIAGKGASALTHAVTQSDQLSKTVEQIVPDLLGVAGLKGGAKAVKPSTLASEAEAAAVRPARTPTEVARAADFQVPHDKPGIGTKVLESVAGPAQLRASRSLANEARATKLASEELGHDPTKPLDEKAFAALKAPHNAAYDEVASALPKVVLDDQFHAAIAKAGNRGGVLPQAALGKTRKALSDVQEMTGQEAIQTVRELRKDAATNRNSDKPKQQAAGQAQRQMADAIDDLMERNAATSLDPTVVTKYKDARTALAKINTVEEATRGGKVSAQELYKAKDKGAPLTGRLNLIADVGENFPTVTRSGALPPEGLEQGMVMRALSATLGPLARKVLQSDRYQGSIAPTAGTLGPGSPLSAYFDTGGPDFQPPPPKDYGSVPFEGSPAGPGTFPPEAMRTANSLAGDLGLTPEGPAHSLPPAEARMGDLTAQTPPTTSGIPFTPPAVPPAASSLAGELGLAPESQGGLPFSPSAIPSTLADHLGLAENTPVDLHRGQNLPTGDLSLEPWDSASSPGGPFQHTQQDSVNFTPDPAIGPYAKAVPRDLGSELSLVDEPLPSTSPQSPTENRTLADELRLVDEPAPAAPRSSPDLGPSGGINLEPPKTPPGVRYTPRELAEATWKEATPEEAARLKPITEELGLNKPQKLEKIPPIVASNQGKVTIEPSDRAGYFKVQVEGKSAPIAEVKGRQAAQDLVDGLDVSDKPAAAKAAPKVTAKIDAKTGEHTIESPSGGLVLRPKGQYLRVQYAQVKKGERGKGNGAALYEKAIESAEAAGKTLGSDVKVSADAARVYDVLERRGYDVTRNPVTIDEKTGELTSKDSTMPAFVVRSKRSDLRATG